MSRRGRHSKRRYNPDPVAVVAASIPSSVPSSVAKAAVAGAAAAVAKTNPRGGRTSRRKPSYAQRTKWRRTADVKTWSKRMKRSRRNPSSKRRAKRGKYQSQDHHSRARSIRKGLRSWRMMDRAARKPNQIRRFSTWSKAHSKWKHRIEVKGNPIYKRGRRSRRASRWGQDNDGSRMFPWGSAARSRSYKKARRHGRSGKGSKSARARRRNPSKSRRRNAPISARDKAALRHILRDHRGRRNNPGATSYRGWTYDTLYDPSGTGSVEVHIFKPSGALFGQYIGVNAQDVDRYARKIIDRDISDPDGEKAYAKDYKSRTKGYRDNY